MIDGPAAYWRPGDDPGGREFALVDNGGKGFSSRAEATSKR